MAVEILPFTAARAPWFERINRAWIETLFAMEPKDYDILGDPKTHIIDPGGEVWFGAWNGEIVGACALVVESPTVVEFSKLGVTEAARGKGVARALLRHCQQRARLRGFETLRIYTNAKLEAANALYCSEGFVEVPMNPVQKARYRRVDIMYDRALSSDNRAAS
jgi:GNAT superfamily N-acetyltransferase